MNNDAVATGQKLGVGRSTVFELWRRGQLKSVTIGKRRFSTDNQIAEFVHGLETAANAAAAAVDGTSE
jgi:hypothetical protein